MDPIDYQSMVDRMFLEDPRNEDRSGDFKLHPSAISGCTRNALYSARGEEPSNPKETRYRRILGNGTDYHEKLQAWLKKQWPGIQTEVGFEYGPIKGHCDALLPVNAGLTDDGESEFWYYDGSTSALALELQEYKSISTNGLRQIKGTNPRRLKSGRFKPGRPAAPKPEHVHQARIYHYCLKKLKRRMSDVIRIVYFERDSWEVAEFEVEPWTPEEGAAQELVWAELEGHLMDGTLPDKMPDGYWLCKLCEFRSVCKPEQYGVS